jgi:hypothetical protein
VVIKKTSVEKTRFFGIGSFKIMARKELGYEDFMCDLK